MAEGLKTPDGAALDPDEAARQFAAAMAAPEPDEPAAPAPPRVTGGPDAPHGTKLDGSPRKSPAGRPPKDRARVSKEPAPGPKEPLPPKDYTSGLNDWVRAAFMITLPFSACDAGAIGMHGPGMASSASDLAQTNARVRVVVEFMTENTAVMALTMTTAALVAQIAVNHGARLPKIIAAMTQDRAELEEFAAETVVLMQAQMKAEQEEAMAAAQAAVASKAA